MVLEPLGQSWADSRSPGQDSLLVSLTVTTNRTVCHHSLTVQRGQFLPSRSRGTIAAQGTGALTLHMWKQAQGDEVARPVTAKRGLMPGHALRGLAVLLLLWASLGAGATAPEMAQVTQGALQENRVCASVPTLCLSEDTAPKILASF